MNDPARNLLDLMPVRTQRFETADDGRVTVLVPRFQHPLLARWVLPLFARRTIRVRLDELGSFVWALCDGATTVEALTELVRERFGGDADEARTRTAQFVRTLVKGDLVTLDRPPEAA